MANMDTNSSNQFVLAQTLSTQSAKKRLNTSGKYVDKDIVIETSVQDATVTLDTVSASNAITVTDNNSLLVTTGESAHAIQIDAKAAVADMNMTVTKNGWIDSSDNAKISGNSNIDADQKTIYVKTGTLADKGGSAEVETTTVKLGAAGSTGTFQIKAKASGSAEVTEAGWLDAGTKASSSGDTTYAVQAASLSNTAATGKTSENYTADNVVLIENSGLFINEGYIKDTYIPLSALVPDDANVGTAAAYGSDKIYKTVSAYDKDGKKVAGTMEDAVLSAITANDAKATVSTVSVAANDDKDAFVVTGSQSITGTTSVDTATTGYAVAGTTKQTGSISGTANVNATLAVIGTGVSVDKTNVTVTPVINTTDATSNALIGTITTTKPDNGAYVAVSTSAISANATALSTVTSAGYGTTDVFTQGSQTITAGAATSGIYYVPINEATHSDGITEAGITVNKPVTTVTTTSTTGDVTPVVVTDANKVTGKKYVTFGAGATTATGSVAATVNCKVSAGYVSTAINENTQVNTDVAVDSATGANINIEVYDGSFDELS